ncbi:MAG: RibD family protein [Leptospirales bacterium]|nr:RibD family protein [Leptospirales bacterium]
MSLDGSTSADGKWAGYSSPVDRQRMDQLRSECDGLLIGSQTLLRDNPNVHVKSNPEKSPVPVSICRSTTLDPALRFFHGPRKPIVFAAAAADANESAEWIVMPPGDITPTRILKVLEDRKIDRLLLEGGPTLARAFLRENLIDRIYLTIVPWVIYEHDTTELIEPKQFRLSSVERMDQEVFLQYDRP